MVSAVCVVCRVRALSVLSFVRRVLFVCGVWCSLYVLCDGCVRVVRCVLCVLCVVCGLFLMCCARCALWL